MANTMKKMSVEYRQDPPPQDADGEQQEPNLPVPQEPQAPTGTTDQLRPTIHRTVKMLKLMKLAHMGCRAKTVKDRRALKTIRWASTSSEVEDQSQEVDHLPGNQCSPTRGGYESRQEDAYGPELCCWERRGPNQGSNLRPRNTGHKQSNQNNQIPRNNSTGELHSHTNSAYSQNIKVESNLKEIKKFYNMLTQNSGGTNYKSQTARNCSYTKHIIRMTSDADNGVKVMWSLVTELTDMGLSGFLMGIQWFERLPQLKESPMYEPDWPSINFANRQSGRLMASAKCRCLHQTLKGKVKFSSGLSIRTM
jgi:hypothetical protein